MCTCTQLSLQASRVPGRIANLQKNASTAVSRAANPERCCFTSSAQPNTGVLMPRIQNLPCPELAEPPAPTQPCRSGSRLELCAPLALTQGI